jgi:glycine cleavage system regulatory protein
METLVITFLGQDRPGLVEALSEAVAERGGNWLESRMAHLAGQFAGLARVEIAPSQSAELIAEWKAVPGLQVSIASQPGSEQAPLAEATLEIVGHDRPGIVSQITRIIAVHRINVEEFSSEIESAPMTGEPLFKALATLGIPEGTDLSQFRTDLEALAADIMVGARLV